MQKHPFALLALFFSIAACSFTATAEVNGFIKNYNPGTEYVYYMHIKKRTVYNRMDVFNDKGEFRFTLSNLNGNPIFDMDSISVLKVDNGKEVGVTSLRYTLDLSGDFLRDSKGTRFRIRKIDRYKWALDNLIIEEAELND